MILNNIKFLANGRIHIENYDNPWNNRNLWHSGLNIDFIKKACNNDINNIVEFGSYDGGDGIRYKYHFPSANVYSIEASPFCYAKMKPLEEYGIKIFNYAISNKCGKALFHGTYDENLDNYAPCGSLNKNYCSTPQPAGNVPLKIMPPIEVPCVTLEAFCSEQKINFIDLLHIDVEGHAVEVISGFGNVRPKLIYIEVSSDTHDHSLEVGQLLTSMNFKKVAAAFHDEIWVDNEYLHLE
tara:strand:- start:670 stop:1386 length:717 start_codon:yes stop_codon:yes gene_type:complete